MPSVASEVARSVQLILDRGRTEAKSLITPVFNVSGYGAKGDGETDDSDALQLAADETAGDYWKPNVMYLPPGNYKITKPLKLKPHTVLMGAGMSLTRITQATPGVPVIAPRDENRGPGKITRRVWIEGLTLSGGSYGVDSENFFESTIKSVRSQDATVAGFRFYNNASSCYYHNLVDIQAERCPVGVLTEAVVGYGVTAVNMDGGIISAVTTGIKLTGGFGTNFFSRVRINDASSEHVYCDTSDNRFEFLRLENQSAPTAKAFRFKEKAFRNVVLFPTVGGLNHPWVEDAVPTNRNHWFFGQTVDDPDPFHINGPVTIAGGYLALGGMTNSRQGWAGSPQQGGDFYWDPNLFGAGQGGLRFHDGSTSRLIPRNVGNMADISAAPTQTDFNNLLAKLRSAGILM